MANGDRIQQDSFNCAETAIIQTEDEWPRQIRPGKKHRTVWTKFLSSLCKDGTTNLKEILGHWTDEPSRRRWKAYYDHQWKVAATLEPNGTWMAREVTKQTRRGWLLGPPIEPININKELFTPVDRIVSRVACISNPEWSNRPNSYEVGKEPRSWEEYIRSIPRWEGTLIQLTNEAPSFRGLWQELIDALATIILVSDGGCADPYWSFGWVIATENEILWEGTGVARGQPMTSHRAEAYGKLSWITFLIHYAQFLGIEIKCKIVSFCDNIKIVNQTALNRIATARDAISADYDIIWQTVKQQEVLKKLAVGLAQSTHIKGHQDKQPGHKLNRQEQLNVCADSLATHTLKALKKLQETPKMIELPLCKAYLLNAGNIQTSNERMTCLWKWSDFRIQNYYCKRLQLPLDSLHRINWEAYRWARRSLTSTEQAFTTKLLMKWLPTGHRTEKYGATLSACHRCGEDKTVDHLFTCRLNVEWKKKCLAKLGQHLTDIGSAADIKRAIVSGMMKWLDRDLTTILTRCPSSMRVCYKLQEEIGWNLTMCGLFDENWRAYQEAFLASTGAKNSNKDGKTWSTKLSAWMICEARKLWITRNSEVHQPTDGPSKIELETIEQVRNLYKLADNMSHHDRAIFDEPLEHRLKQPIRTLQRWVKNTIPTANRCIRDFQQKLAEKQSDIRKFFLMKERDPVQMQAPLAIQAETNDLSG